MKLLQQRKHRNGRIAEVRLQDDGRLYFAWAAFPPGISQGAADIETLAQARDIADSYAHPDCDGSCPGWQDHQ